mmetsp:Transcript_22796/g.73058  ORF Transcript_22796/g.73058 Transcript_22796/m.73058 type:complete len:200 (+) Transcript_22796:2-601(+)
MRRAPASPPSRAPWLRQSVSRMVTSSTTWKRRRRCGGDLRAAPTTIAVACFSSSAARAARTGGRATSPSTATCSVFSNQMKTSERSVISSSTIRSKWSSGCRQALTPSSSRPDTAPKGAFTSSRRPQGAPRPGTTRRSLAPPAGQRAKWRSCLLLNPPRRAANGWTPCASLSSMAPASCFRWTTARALREAAPGAATAD